MSNNNPLSTPLTIERNGVSAPLTVFVGKRDAWKDKPYQAFQIQLADADTEIADDPQFLDGLKFWGKVNVQRALNTIARRFGQDFIDDATGDEDTEKAGGLPNGIFSQDKFVEFWQKLKSSALRLSELNEAYQTAVAEFTNYTTNTLMNEVQSGDPVRIADAQRKVASLGNAVKSYQAEFDERKARRSKEAATETLAAA